MKTLLVGMVMLLSVAGFVNAAEEAVAVGVPAEDMGVTIDLSYTTKYMWRGFDILDDKGAWQPSVNLDLGSGFSANLWMSYADGGGTTDAGLSRVDLTEYNYTLAYDGSLLEDGVWKTNYQLGWRYYDYIDTGSKDADRQEVYITGEMPALTGCGAVPHFGVFQMWPSQGGGAVRDFSGTIYLMGVGYDFELDDAPDLPMTFTWDIVYNDGTGGSGVDHDWSHMVWGLSTSMTCPATGGTLTPGIYFQNSFDSSVNDEDELWANISYKFSF